jgi:hypothetical protein
VARAARQKQAKKGRRRTDAREKRVTRPGAKPARGGTARTRTAAKARLKQLRVAKQRVKMQLASAKRALRVAVTKRIVKKRVASLKRTVAKRLARAGKRVKSAKKRATTARTALAKRLTRAVKAAKKRTTAARRVVRKRVLKRVKSIRSTIRRAARKVAPRRALAQPPRPVPPAFAVQRANATPREELLFELQRARASVKAAVQGLGAGLADSPVAPGKWSIKEIVLHLSERDRVRLEEFARTIGGQPRSWAGVQKREETDQNEVHLSPLRAHSWDDALRRLDTMREQLLLRLSEVPAEPDDVWRRGHPFADMMWGLPEHDRLHAHQIKLARIGANDPVEA